jgi:hypothetical protein
VSRYLKNYRLIEIKFNSGECMVLDLKCLTSIQNSENSKKRLFYLGLAEKRYTYFKILNATPAVFSTWREG